MAPPAITSHWFLLSLQEERRVESSTLAFVTITFPQCFSLTISSKSNQLIMSMIQVVESYFFSLPQSTPSPKSHSQGQPTWTRQSFERRSLIITSGTSDDSESESDSDSDCFEDAHDDHEIIQQEVKRANQVWNESYADVPDAYISTPINPRIKVNFSSQLISVQTFEDDEESRASRLGFWKIDADRFKHRIQEVGQVLAPILDSNHRNKVLQSRQHLTS